MHAYDCVHCTVVKVAFDISYTMIVNDFFFVSFVVVGGSLYHSKCHIEQMSNCTHCQTVFLSSMCTQKAVHSE